MRVAILLHPTTEGCWECFRLFWFETISAGMLKSCWLAGLLNGMLIPALLSSHNVILDCLVPACTPSSWL